ncbi:unnamed protein product [Trifolium pratense]|uniref:Uncharacterized protein n=1 Tax=Trifolium pratense TaxID=57577 RepID=A0ACB0J701_TRIPR|nr:unnamed protein product [Trifolium pratense]
MFQLHSYLYKVTVHEKSCVVGLNVQCIVEIWTAEVVEYNVSYVYHSLFAYFDGSLRNIVMKKESMLKSLSNIRLLIVTMILNWPTSLRASFWIVTQVPLVFDGVKVNMIMKNYTMPGMTGYELHKKIKGVKLGGKNYTMDTLRSQTSNSGGSALSLLGSIPIEDILWKSINRQISKLPKNKPKSINRQISKLPKNKPRR